MYPDIEPYEHGMLPVGDGNEIYWECCGNPNGKSAMYFHGGPGSGSSRGARRFFDPAAYRVVLFDQRGCGRSRPLVSSESDLRVNTTQHLISDVEALREHLSIDSCLILGASWGVTLALAYAQAYPNRVTALVLASVTTTSQREVDWLTSGVRRFFPQQWERFKRHVPARLRAVRLVDAYASLLFDKDSSVRDRAADEWCTWEDAHVSMAPGYTPNKRFLDAEFRLRFARIVTHYWRNAAFLQEGELLSRAGRLSEIPGFLIHGAHDVSSPPETAWDLHEHWPGSRMQLLSDAGHGGTSVSRYVASALDELRDL